MNAIPIILSIILVCLALGYGVEASSLVAGAGGDTQCSASYPCKNVCGDHICKVGEVYVPRITNHNANGITNILSENQVSTNSSFINMAFASNGSKNINTEFSFLGQPIINNNDDIIFPASTNRQTNGIFKLSNGIMTKIVSSGDQVPTPIGGVFESVDLPSSNGNKTIFYGTISQGLADEGIFESFNNTIVKIVVKGDKIPGGGVFDDLGFPPQAINKKGDIFFYGSVKSGINGSRTFEDINFTTKTGIFVYSNGIISKVTSKYEPSPLGGNFSAIQYGLHPINNAGDIVFSSSLLGGPVFQGIFKYSNGKILPVISTLNYNADGLKFSRFESPSINNKGDIVFFGGNTHVPSSKGIYKISSGHLSKIVSVGDPTPVGGVFYHMDAISVNDNGDISFLGFMKSGPSNYGIFKISGNKILAVSNDKVSPMGSTFSSVFIPIMNENGKIVFSANMKSKDPTLGIFVMNPNSTNGEVGIR